MNPVDPVTRIRLPKYSLIPTPQIGFRRSYKNTQKVHIPAEDASIWLILTSVFMAQEQKCMRKPHFRTRWARFWMQKAGRRLPYSVAVRLATLGSPPFYARVALSRWNKRGYISPKARISHADIILGTNCYVDDEVLVFRDEGGGPVTLGNGVHLHHGTFIQTGAGGTVVIDENTHIQPRCQLSGYAGEIRIGREVEIAPRCAFYPYNHGMEAEQPVRNQPLTSQGGIRVGNRAWLGYGVIVLDGAHIGDDAIVGAGSVVTKDIPAGCIAAGNPAKVIRDR